MDELNDVYVPIRVNHYTPSECTGREKYVIDGKEYAECDFCSASCPSRNYFKEPDSGLPLRCDMCEADPPLSEPMCVQVCRNEALAYEEREEEVEEEVKQEDVEIGLESMVDKYGFQNVMDTVARLSMSKKK
jgi:benzoyl-CoA reductase subunit BamC